MIQRADPPDSVALEASARIAGAVRAWRVVLFGSRARGTARPDSDYDFYVEVDADASELGDIDRNVRESLYRGGLAFDLKVMPRGSLERRRNDPGTLEWDVAREGKVLFADPVAPTCITPATRVREPRAQPPESVAEWVESAERDRRHVELMWGTGDDFWPEICWFAQLMCEKLMKALLVSRFVRPARTHDLTALLQAARAIGIDLDALDADCALLTAHAVVPRYPAGLGLTEQDAREASAAAERIAAAVRSQLDGLSASSTPSPPPPTADPAPSPSPRDHSAP